MHRIREDVSERLDVVPAQFRVLVVRQPKYACRACTDGVAQAPAPARLIEGGLPTDATVAKVLVSKFADHLPLYRLAQIFARQGMNLDRSTLADWVGRAALLLEPVHGRLLDHLKASTKLFADETTAPVLDPGQLWAYARDDLPAVAYVYAPDRKAERPMAHLAGFSGVLQGDGYEGYRALTKGSAVKLAFCWSHVRRGFIDLAAKGASPIAAEVLTRIAALYRIQGEIAGLSAEARHQARAERSRPLLTALERFLGDKLALLSQKSTLAVAIRYATSRWAGLTLYVDDGRVANSTTPVPSKNKSLSRSVRFERKAKTVPQNGSAPSCSRTSMARPSMPLRKSTGRVAGMTRTAPEGLITSRPSARRSPPRSRRRQHPGPPAPRRRRSPPRCSPPGAGAGAASRASTARCRAARARAPR